MTRTSAEWLAADASGAYTAVSCYVYSGAEAKFNYHTGQCGNVANSDTWNNGRLHQVAKSDFLTNDVMGLNSEKVLIAQGDG
jgi:hypothetical protein